LRHTHDIAQTLLVLNRYFISVAILKRRCLCCGLFKQTLRIR
jgi:hypothetical protein